MYGDSERNTGEEEAGNTTQEMSRPVIFLGYMGAGKTTVGKAFAQDTGKRFYDLDWYIETRMHRTVRQIFDESGEEGFRRIERNMLRRRHAMLLRQHRIYEQPRGDSVSQSHAGGALRTSEDGTHRQTAAPRQVAGGGEGVREGTARKARAVLQSGKAYVRREPARQL